MRFILKVFTLPIMLILTLLNAVLSFFCSATGWVCRVLSLLFMIAAFYSCFIDGDKAEALREIIVAFLLSPFAIPALAWWIIEKLDDLKCSLHCFMTD